MARTKWEVTRKTEVKPERPHMWNKDLVSADAKRRAGIDSYVKEGDISRGSAGTKTGDAVCLTAFVCTPSDDALNTVNTASNYVIIGRGFSAVVNHSTLLQSVWGRRRLNACGNRVVYLGLPDPWLDLVHHDMNQDGMLLIHPGFVYPINNRNSDLQLTKWMFARRFARNTQFEIEKLRKIRETKVVNGFVTEVRRDADVAYQYEVLYFGREQIRQLQEFAQHQLERGRKLLISESGIEPLSIKARFVDICSGPGLAKLVNIGYPKAGAYDILMDDALVHEYLKLSDNPGARRIFAGSDYVRADTPMPANARVCIRGLNTPAGVQAMERAFGLDRGAGQATHVFGISSRGLEGGFPPNGRLDGMASKTANGPALQPSAGFLSSGSILHPGPQLNDKSAVFGHNYQISEIQVITGVHVGNFRGIDGGDVGKLLVQFRATKKNGLTNNTYSKSLNCAPDQDMFEFGVFDQVVICGGQQTGQDEAGGPLDMIKTLATDGEDFSEMRPIEAGDYDHPLGLRVEGCGAHDDPTIRVLGGAAHGSDIMRKNWLKDARDELTAYENTLPLQARVLQRGATLAAVTIAQANHYFHENDWPNRNVNTGTWFELIKLEEASHCTLIQVEKVRSVSRSGFADKDELALALTFEKTYPDTFKKKEFLFYRDEAKGLCIGGVERAGESVSDWVQENERDAFNVQVETCAEALEPAIDENNLIFRYDPGVYGGRTYKERYKHRND